MRAARQLHVHRDGKITWRIGEVRRHLIGNHVPEQLLCAGVGAGFGLSDINQCGVGEPVYRHILATSGLAPAAPVGLVNALRRLETGEKCRLDVATSADLSGPARAGGADPHRRVRLLHWPRPNIN